MIAGGTTFTLLNSSIDAQTAYVDSTVASGTTYSYEVKSVDNSGMESTGSNQFTVAIP
jgi:fibronectin type 3 domain-containing protein